MRGMRLPPRSGTLPTRGAIPRSDLFDSGVLEFMLSRARRHMRSARRRAAALGARRLATWAAAEERRLGSLLGCLALGTSYAV